MSYRTLGALEASVGDRRVPISSTKQRILLASLLLRANRLVTIDELIDRLWAHPPSDARGTAQVHLGRLRRTLGAAGAAGALIRTDPNGYVIEVADDDLDIARFAGLAGRARQERDGYREIALLKEALALWQGRPLSNVPSDLLQRSDVPRLVEQRLQTAERRFELELELGDGKDMIGELRELATAEPFRERLWALLMTALYRQGRQQEALECYRACSTVLREEIGLDPGQELRDLHEAILRRSLEVPRARVRREIRALPARWDVRLGSPCQLPPEIGDFVGRTAELRQIVAHFAARGRPATVPIVAVVGCPGVGKTALAVKAAHALRDRFPDGQLYIQLDGSTERPRDPVDALGDLLSGLGERSTTRGDLDGRAAMLRERLADRQVLLVVDDVADVRQARAVLPGTRGCGILLTSRQRLVDLPGVERVRPAPLTPCEALAFLERLAGAGRVRKERSAAEEIALLCGHLPLALRIMGSRLALRPSEALARVAASLRDESRRLDQLATQNLQMRSVLDASYAALDPAARALLRRLGALRGTEFVEGTALALAGGEGVLALDRLVEANLVEPVESGACGESRYRLYDLVGIHASQYVG
ncbi:AfsR/SARP family transcriptional regulator [Actinomadura rubrisoli]|uniref:AfsR/SARP family transcriptional regulator n=1 Tax=Actinomadura rubrisoli TaxID=2530368 RepID=A0A4R5BUT0_9ACTN|nr:AfsR/SARP family transcriptional regulator [Actinomadura rubrisoli]TDD89849.1 AfsR/SARP family transcriptional regulator [Actinomadura rubrisoli]